MGSTWRSGYSQLFRQIVHSNGLVGFWPLNERSGDIIDHSPQRNHGTIPAGLVHGYGIPIKTRLNAALFTAANSEYLSVNANSASILSPAANDSYSFNAWANPDTLPSSGNTMGIISKWSATGFAYALYIENTGGTSKFKFAVRNQINTATTTVSADSFGALTADRWYRIKCYHDADNDIIAIGVNNGDFDTASHTGGTDGVSFPAFNVGRWAGANYFNGRIAGIGYWKRVLASAEWADLYPALRYGLSYPQLPLSLRQSLFGYWNLTDAGGKRRDSVGSNPLTDNNTVTVANGVLFEGPFDLLGSGFNGAWVVLGDISPLKFERDTPFSMMAIVTPDLLSSVATILSKGAGWAWHLNSSRALVIILNDGTNDITVTSPNVLSAGSPTVIGISYDGSSAADGVVLYEAGVAVAGTCGGCEVNASIANTSDALIGSGFLGDIAMLAVWNRVVPASEFRRYAFITDLH